MAQFGVQTFNGGEVNRIRPHLLKSQFATDTLDADIVDGSLRSFRASVRTSDSVEELDNQNTTGTLSVVKFGEEFYSSNNDTGELTSTLGYFGLTPPNLKPSVKPNVFGDRFTGIYKYLITFETPEGWESAPFIQESVPLFSVVNTRIVATVLTQGDVDGFNTTHYVHRKRYGYTAGDRVNYIGKTWECIQSFAGTPQTERRQPVRPDQFPGADNGRLWKDVTLLTITVSGFQEIVLTDFPTPVESAVTKINIFRSIADGGALFFVDTIDVGTTSYVDTRGDEEILTARQINLSHLAYPPIFKSNEDGSFTRVGGKFLTEVDERFYLAVGDRVYLSKQSSPHSWSFLDFLEFRDEVTGIARQKDGILVFTSNNTNKVTGLGITDIVNRQLPNVQGCPNYRTISYLQNAPVWMSNDGLCRYGFVPDFQAEILQVLTEGTFSFPKGAKFAEVANDVYFLFYDGFAICIDFRKERVIYKRSFDADLAAYDKDNDRLLLRKASGETEVTDAGADLEFSWTSPEYSFNSVNETKQLRSIWIDATGLVKVTAFANGVEKFQSTSDRTGNRPLFFNDRMRGERFQFKFEAKGEIRGFMVVFHLSERGAPFCEAS